MQGLGYSDGAS
jgi:uncharacterized protein with GYD domain